MRQRLGRTLALALFQVQAERLVLRVQAAEAGVEVAAAAAIESAVNAANVEIGIGKNVARPTQMNETGAAGA